MGLEILPDSTNRNIRESNMACNLNPKVAISFRYFVDFYSNIPALWSESVKTKKTSCNIVI